MDREEQVQYLKQIAADINDGMVGNGTPAEQVSYFLDNEKMPDWFNDHDRNLLIEFVTA